MKSKILFIALIAGITGLIMPTGLTAQTNPFHLIKNETTFEKDTIKNPDLIIRQDGVLRFREVQLDYQIKSLNSISKDDTISLNLFEDASFEAIVTNIQEYVPGNVTITAKILFLGFSSVIISTYEGRTLITVDIPEKDRQFQIKSDPQTLKHYLIETDPHLLEMTEDSPPSIESELPVKEFEKQAGMQKENPVKNPGPNDPATIDVMYVYTISAFLWAETLGGGMINNISLAMAKGQLALDNSLTLVNLRLIHHYMTSYVESGNLNTDLHRMSDLMDEYLQDVPGVRNLVGADLVQLWVANQAGGLGWPLMDAGGSEAYAYTVTGILAPTQNFANIHEFGHNIGCGHNKSQINCWPGGGIFSYSAGWRWYGADMVQYCDLMSYCQDYCYADGTGNIDIPYFSNPSVYYMGTPAGDAGDGDNARTIRETKHIIAAYRSPGNCFTCPGFDYEFPGLSTFNSVGSSIDYGGCRIFKIPVITGQTYLFTTGCGQGTASFDTYLTLMDGSCNFISVDDDGCENGRSKIFWIANYSGFAFLEVKGFGSAFGTFTLAVLNPEGCTGTSQYPNYTLAPELNWKYQPGLHPGVFSRFYVNAGTTYSWSLCAIHGGFANYDSQLTLRSVSDNSILAFSEDATDCGANSLITWTAGFSGSVDVVITEFQCSTGALTTTLAYRSGPPDIPYVSITPLNRYVTSSAGFVTYDISSNTSWEFADNAAWITSISPSTGIGNGTITATYNENTSANQRIGTILGSAPGINNTPVYITQFPADVHCNSTSQWGTEIMPADNWQYLQTFWAGEYSLFTVTAGIQYHWSLCPEHGGYSPFDSELTLRRADNNAHITHTDDVCGDDAMISWVADFTGTVKIILTKYPCASQNSGCTLAYKRGTLSNIAVNLLPAYREVMFYSGTSVVEVVSNTSWTLTKDAGWITGLSQTSGTGNATASVIYEANSTSTQRTGKITVTGGGNSVSVTVTQLPNDAYGYCNSVTQWGGLLIPTENWQQHQNLYAGEYARFAVIEGNQYNWSLCPEHSGFSDFDSELTLRRAYNNELIIRTDDVCGDDALISWIADTTAEVKVVLTKYPCNSYAVGSRLAYKKGFPEVPSLTITPVNQSLVPDGGSVALTITSNTFWSLSIEDYWISLSQFSGTGNATVWVSYQANNGSSRTATITGTAFSGPTGITATLTQIDYCNSSSFNTLKTPSEIWEYIDCIYAGEYAVFPVTAGQKYQWSLCDTHGAIADFDSQLTLRKASDDSFLAYSDDECGTGFDAYITWVADFSGNVKLVVSEYYCQSNGITCARLGYKKGDLNPPYLQLSPDYQMVSSGAGTVGFNIMSNTNWTMSEDIAWLSILPSYGTGNGAFFVNYTENTSVASRSGFITISATGAADVLVSVNQAGVEPTLLVLPAVQNVTSLSGTVSFDVVTETVWTVIETETWLHATPTIGAGNGSFTVDYEENNSSIFRTGSITVTLGGDMLSQTVTLNQEGTTPILSVSPQNRSVTAPTGSTTFSITSNTSWTVSENATWFSVLPMNGTGNGQLNVTYSENATGVSRSGNILVTANGGSTSSTVSVTQASYPVHSISLSAGWRGLSSYLIPANNDIADVFAPILPWFVMAATMTSIYYPAGQINTIGTWDSQSAYKLKMAAPASLNIIGPEETNKVLAMTAGWNLIPVICNTPVNASTLFGTTGMVIVKDVAGMGVLWPAMNINTLGDLMPGMAYFAKLNAPATITFPQNSDEALGGHYPAFRLPDHPWNEVTISASSHLVAIKASGMSSILPSDLIGVFTADKKCCGVIRIEDISSNAIITAYADDPLTETKDGFINQEEMQFIVYRPRTSEYFETEPVYDLSVPNQETFKNEGISVIQNLNVLKVGIENLFDSGIVIYPNPAGDKIWIEGIRNVSEIRVTNAMGEILKTYTVKCQDKIALDLTGLMPGIYQIHFISEKGIIILKVVKNR